MQEDLNPIWKSPKAYKVLLKYKHHMKITPHPYIVRLAMRMLFFEIEIRLGYDPNKKEVYEILYQQNKSSDSIYSKSVFDNPHKRDSVAHQFVNYLRKSIWDNEKRIFDLFHLNKLAQQFTLFEPCESWKDFEKKFYPSNHYPEGKFLGFHDWIESGRPDVAFARNKYLSFSVVEDSNKRKKLLHRLDQLNMEAFVSSRMNTLIMRLVMSGKLQGKNFDIIDIGDDYVIRKAENEDLPEITERLAYKNIDILEIFKAWFKQNENVFFVYYNERELKEAFIILPVSKKTYDNVVKGKTPFLQIPPEEILGKDHDKKIGYLLTYNLTEIVLGNVPRMNPYVFRTFTRFKIPDILSRITILHPGLRISDLSDAPISFMEQQVEVLVPKSEYEELLIKIGFTKRNLVSSLRRNKQAFYEITYNELQNFLNPKEESERISF